MDETNCWKCDTPLVEENCPTCDYSAVELLKSLDRSKDHVDSMGNILDSFKKKIASYRDESSKMKSGVKDIGYAINTLCNIIDLLEEDNSHLISFDDLDEVHEKTQQILGCVESLRKIKQASDEQTSQ